MLSHLHPTASKNISSMTYSSNGSLYGEMRYMTTRNILCCLPLISHAILNASLPFHAFVVPSQAY
jgi:hypothetical protein